MIAIYKREIRAYLHNVYGFLFAAVILLLAGVLMLAFNFIYGTADMTFAMPELSYALILMVPILCMRSMAEDKQNKTDLFYRSLPIPTWKVVLGKYLAILTVLAVPTLILCLYPLVLAIYGASNFGGAYAAILMFFLLAASLAAVCQFMSSLTDHLVVAAVLGVVATLALFGLPFLADALSASATVLSDVLNYVSPFYHYSTTLSWQMLGISSVLLPVSYAVLFVWLTTLSADRKHRG